MQSAKNQGDENFKLRQKLKMVVGQIEVLAERMATLPKELDLKPLVDQLGKLQSSKVDMEEELKRQESEKP
ncbi:MAG: hypothetical protein ACK5V3_09480, partial [Bdellovibrionales bacterium]